MRSERQNSGKDRGDHYRMNLKKENEKRGHDIPLTATEV